MFKSQGRTYGISGEPQRSATEGKLRHPQKGYPQKDNPQFQCLIPKSRQSEDIEQQGTPGDPLEQGWWGGDPNLSTGFKKRVPEEPIWSRNVCASSFQRLWHHQRGRISKCGREGTVKKRLSLAWYRLGISLSVEKKP